MKQRCQHYAIVLVPSAVMAALVMFMAAGCVRVPVKRDKIETRLISVTANGYTVLSWNSRADMIYTVLVADRLTSSHWEPLPSGINLRGTGATMQLGVQEVAGGSRTYKLIAAPLRPPAPLH